MSKRSLSDPHVSKKGGKLLPALCNLIGILIILIVIAFCLALVLPPKMGYQVYNIMTGSMEPEIPVGSIIYVEYVKPEQIAKGEVIVFQQEDFIVAHRVVENQTVVGEFVTKGDANATEDMNTVPYNAVIGRVAWHMARLGQFMALYSSSIGKIYVLGFALCGVLFNILAVRLRDRERERRAEQRALQEQEKA